jgi:hypothetical protein
MKYPMTPARLKFFKNFLDECEQKFPLTDPENRRRAMTWVYELRDDAPELAEEWKQKILSYERPVS